MLKDVLNTYKFYIFALLLSGIAVHWSFTYIQARYGQFFSGVMWGMFIFYAVAFFLIGSFSLLEMVDQYFHKRKIRELAATHETAIIEKLEADTTLILSKIGQSDEDKVIEATPLLSSGVVVDLSEHIKIKPQFPLIETVSKYSRILVIGGQGSGKTQIILWLAEAKQKMGNVVAIDTHASPEKWPIGSHVLGFGLDYNQAERGFDQVINLMSRRYEQIGQGKAKERSHPIISVLTDEWTDLPDMIPNFKKQFVKPLFTKSRKASIDLSLAAHDDTVEALGMEGLAGFKKSFDISIYCECIEEGIKYSAKVFYGLKTSHTKCIECLPPGPYIPGMEPLQPQQKYIDFDIMPGILVDDIRVLDAMRMNYDSQINGIWKQHVRKDLGIPASQEGYKIIDKVGKRYNLTLK